MDLSSITELGMNISFKEEFDTFFYIFENNLKYKIQHDGLWLHDVGENIDLHSKQHQFILNYILFFKKNDLKYQNETEFWILKKHPEVFNNEHVDKFFQEKPALYWFEFFNEIVSTKSPSFLMQKYFPTYTKDSKERFEKFLNALIQFHINKMFEIYKVQENDILDFHDFKHGLSIGAKLLQNYIKSHFEKLHENIDSFCFILQNYDIPIPYWQIYPTLDQFKNYFNTYDKIQKDDYVSFQKFWGYAIKFQKLPFEIFTKYLINFEKDKVLKEAINSSHHYKYYFSRLEEIPVWYKKIKIFQ